MKTLTGALAIAALGLAAVPASGAAISVATAKAGDPAA